MLLQRSCTFTYVTGAIRLLWDLLSLRAGHMVCFVLFFGLFKAYLLFPAPQSELCKGLQHAHQVVRFGVHPSPLGVNVCGLFSLFLKGLRAFPCILFKHNVDLFLSVQHNLL